MLVFNDGKSPQAVVWGYRYNGSKTMKQMCEEIAEADPRLFYQEGNNGSTVNGFGVDFNGNGIFSLQNPDDLTEVVTPTEASIAENVYVDDFLPTETEDRWCAGFSMDFWYLSSNGWTAQIGGWTGAVWGLWNGGESMETATYGSIPELNPSCPSLSGDLQLLSLSQNEATLSWNPSEAASYYQIERKLFSESDWTNAITDQTTDTLYQFSDLTENTKYNCRVRAVCGSENESMWSMTTFKTECNAIETLPYSENFDTYEGGSGVLPDCWAVLSDVSAESNICIIYGNSYSSSSPNSFRFAHNANATYMAAMLPLFEEELNLLSVTFSMRHASLSNNGIIVGVLEDVADFGSFVAVDTVYNDQPTAYNRYEVSFTDYSGEGGRIAFVPLWANTNKNMHLDDILVDFAPECSRPDNLQAVRGDSGTSVEISWSDNGDNNQWLIHYKAVNESDYTFLQVNTMPYTIEDLSLQTTYSFIVSSLCAGGDTVTAFQTIEYTTPCLEEAVSEFPWTEGFESGLTCWEQTLVSGNLSWQEASSATVSGGSLPAPEGMQCAKLKANSRGNVTIMASPILDLSLLETPTLTFKHIQAKWSSDQDTLRVYYKNSPDAEPVLLAEYGENITSWRSDTIFLAEPTEYYQLLFEGTIEYGYGIFVDDLVVSGIEIAPCDNPSDLIVENITHNSCTITWTGASENYEIRINGGQTENVNTQSKTYDDLLALTNYVFEVRAVCESNQSEWVSVSFTTLEEPIIQPTVLTLQVGEIGTQTAVLNARITKGSEEIEDMGFMYRAENASEWSMVSAQEQGVDFSLQEGETELSLTISDLQEANVYHYKAFARTQSATTEGEQMSFTTLSGLALLENNSMELSIHPNPTADFVNLNLKGLDERAELLLYNTQGSVVLREWINPMSQNLKLDLKGLQQGVYYLRLIGSKTVSTCKIILQ